MFRPWTCTTKRPSQTTFSKYVCHVVLLRALTRSFAYSSRLERANRSVCPLTRVWLYALVVSHWFTWWTDRTAPGDASTPTRRPVLKCSYYRSKYLYWRRNTMIHGSYQQTIWLSDMLRSTRGCMTQPQMTPSPVTKVVLPKTYRQGSWWSIPLTRDFLCLNDPSSSTDMLRSFTSTWFQALWLCRRLM